MTRHQGVPHLVYCADASKLRYDFVVRSGAAPGRMHLAYEANSVTTYQGGNLQTSTGSVRWYSARGSSIRTTGDTARRPSYSFLTGKVWFALAKRGQQGRFGDRTRAGVSTYLGGSSTDRVYSIAADCSGAAHVIGRSNSTSLPTATTTTGAYQTGEGGIPVSAREIATWPIPLSAQLDARHSQERLCNGF